MNKKEEAMMSFINRGTNSQDLIDWKREKIFIITSQSDNKLIN